MYPTLDQFLADRVLPKHRPIVLGVMTLIQTVAPSLNLRMAEEYHKDLVVPVWGGVDDAIVLVPSKSGVIFEFVHGARFLDPFDLLQGQGRSLRRLKLRHLRDFDPETMAFLVRESVRVDAELAEGL